MRYLESAVGATYRLPAARFSGCTTGAPSQADVDCPEPQEVLVSKEACLQFNNTREDSTHGNQKMVNTKIRLIIFFAAKDGEALYSPQKQDRELTVVHYRYERWTIKKAEHQSISS